MASKKGTVSNRKTVVNLQQLTFIKLYFTPGTEYFGNAYRSAIKAGYDDSYAKVILQKDLAWLEQGIKEFVGGPTDINNLKNEARKVLSKSLKSDDENLAQNTAKFIAEKLDEDFQKNKQTVQLEVVPIYGGKTGSEE